jgi:hypothetical protein
MGYPGGSVLISFCYLVLRRLLQLAALRVPVKPRRFLTRTRADLSVLSLRHSHSAGESCDRFNQRMRVDRFREMSLKTSVQCVLSVVVCGKRREGHCREVRL